MALNLAPALTVPASLPNNRTGTVRISEARSIWSGTISFGQRNNFPLLGPPNS
jgi:hypothetical protein